MYSTPNDWTATLGRSLPRLHASPHRPAAGAHSHPAPASRTVMRAQRARAAAAPPATAAAAAASAAGVLAPAPPSTTTGGVATPGRRRRRGRRRYRHHRQIWDHLFFSPLHLSPRLQVDPRAAPSPRSSLSPFTCGCPAPLTTCGGMHSSRLAAAADSVRPAVARRQGVHNAGTAGVAAAGRSRRGGSRPERERDGHGTLEDSPARSYAGVWRARHSPAAALLPCPRPPTPHPAGAPRSPSPSAPSSSAVGSVVASIAKTHIRSPAHGMAVARRRRETPRG